MAEQTGWLVELSQTGPTLYVFPHGGAGSSAVAGLAAELAGDARVVAVRLPGRESSAHLPCETDVDVIAAAVAAQIRADETGGERVVLYGHCAGAVIAYEVAALLADTLHGTLVVSSHGSPDRTPRPGVWAWSDDEFLDRVAQDGFLPPEVRQNEELREICLPPLRGDYQAIETHHSLCDVLAWPITALHAEGATSVAEQDIRSWAALTGSRFELLRVPGPHHLLTGATAALASALRSLLEVTS